MKFLLILFCVQCCSLSSFALLFEFMNCHQNMVSNCIMCVCCFFFNVFCVCVSVCASASLSLSSFV